MNEKRRKKLYDIQQDLKTSKTKLGLVLDEEQISFDNLTEGLQATIRGSIMEETIDNIYSTIDLIDEAIMLIDDIIL